MPDVKFMREQLGSFPDFPEAWAAYSGEMRRKGWHAGWPANPRFVVFGILYDDELISFISVAELKDKTAIVTGAWTHPIHRRKGLYNELIRIVINYYRLMDDMEWLLSGYRKENLPSAAMQASQGREIYEDLGDRVRTRLSLVKTGDEFPIASPMLRGIMEALDPDGV